MAADELWAGRYRRDRLLGRGAMGEVWAARDVVLDRPVAIKSISASRTDPEDQQRMAREARVAARITHPNAVAVHDLVTVDDRPNLVMEYVDGDTLADRIRRGGRIDEFQVAAIGAAVADALAEAHRLGVVHRDIKPANILITPRGVPKLADFGIARVAGDANMTATGMMIGTPAYLAPEIVEGGTADTRTDVWSLGVTLYAALEGAPPFVVRPDDEPFVVLGRVLHAPIRPPAAAGSVTGVVMAMLDRDPSRRPAAEQVAAALRAARTSSPGQGTTQVQRSAATTRTFDPSSSTTRSTTPSTDPSAGWSAATRTDRRLPPDAPAGPPPSSPHDQRDARDSHETGPEPLLPGVWSTDEQRRHAAQPRRRTGRVAAVLSAVVVVAVAAVVALLLVRSHDHSTPAAATSPSTSPSTSSSTATSPAVSTSATGGAGTSASSGPSAPTPENGERYYVGPGGIRVIAPTGWSRDTGAGNNNVIDYDAPGSTGFVSGLAFQVGIGNPHALPTIQGEAEGAEHYLRSVDRDVSFPQTTFGTYLGAPSVTIEYFVVNSHDVSRHGIERLWVSGGVTREVVVSGRTDQWSSALPIFEQLVGSARVMN